MRHFLANPWPNGACRVLALAACASAMTLALSGCAAPAEEPQQQSAPIIEGATAESLIDGAAETAGATAGASQADQASRQDARIDVYNGWFAEGMAARAAEELRAAGFVVSAVANADTPGLEQSHVAYRAPAFEAVAREAAQQLGIDGVSLSEPGEGKGWAYEGDVAVVLGGDWAQSRGMASS